MLEEEEKYEEKKEEKEERKEQEEEGKEKREEVEEEDEELLTRGVSDIASRCYGAPSGNVYSRHQPSAMWCLHRGASLGTAQC